MRIPALTIPSDTLDLARACSPRYEEREPMPATGAVRRFHELGLVSTGAGAPRLYLVDFQDSSGIVSESTLPRPSSSMLLSRDGPR